MGTCIKLVHLNVSGFYCDRWVPHQYIAWQRTVQAETDHAKGLESPIHIGLLPATPILQNDSRREQQEDNYLQKQRDNGGVQLHPHQQAMVPD